MTAAQELPLADTSDMIGLHRVFRIALDGTEQLVSGAGESDAARADMVSSYYLNVLSLLHAHHDGEDLIMTPTLAERLPDSADVVKGIAQGHLEVTDALARSTEALRSWGADATAANRDAAAAALIRLRTTLVPHLDEEERVVLPLAATCMNVAEWGQLPAHGLKNFQGDKVWLILGLIQEQMNSAQIAHMEAHMPPPVVEFWTGQGKGLFTGFIGELRG